MAIYGATRPCGEGVLRAAKVSRSDTGCSQIKSPHAVSPRPQRKREDIFARIEARESRELNKKILEQSGQ
jgi:hypothetical protein